MNSVVLCPATLDLWEAEISRVPWRGQSPRALTRARKALFLSQAAQKDDCFFVDPDQVDLWIATKKAPWIYQGAPLLKGG